MSWADQVRQQQEDAGVAPAEPPRQQQEFGRQRVDFDPFGDVAVTGFTQE